MTLTRTQILIKISLAAWLFLSCNAHAESFFQTNDLNIIETTDESDDEINQQVRELSTAQGDPQKIQTISEQIFDLIKQGKNISDYDYLWTLYAVIMGAGPEMEGGTLQQDYLNITDTAMNFLHTNGVGDWVYTDLGQFKLEVYKQAANAAAWTLRETKPKQALPYIDAGLEFMNDQDLWMLDTKVRILLNLNQQDEAYTIVKAVLSESPNFVDFQDFKTDENYSKWLDIK